MELIGENFPLYCIFVSRMKALVLCKICQSPDDQRRRVLQTGGKSAFLAEEEHFL
jgi:hypothetical protein